MKTLLACALVALTASACHHAPAPAAPVAAAEDPETDPNNAAIDPTMPSWSPRSCNAYHTAVVRIVDCPQIEQTRRAQIKAQYDVDHAKWQAMTNQAPEALDQVREDCRTAWRSLHDQYTAAQCVPQAAPQTATTP